MSLFNKPTLTPPLPSVISKRRLRMELAVRYEMANPAATDAEIATHLGLSAGTVAQWRSGIHKDEYNNLKNQVVTGLLSEIDIENVDNVRYNQERLSSMVPLAMMNLYDLALQKTNAAIRLKASQEILDRHGHFAKVSRIGLPSNEQGGVADTKDNDVASALVSALSTVAAKPSIKDDPVSEKVQ